jgi:hypothetical protein
LSNDSLYLTRAITRIKRRLINGKELTTKDGVQIEKDVNNNRYSLTIPKANPSAHAGVITIKATNAIGSAQHELSLNILGNIGVVQSKY